MTRTTSPPKKSKQSWFAPRQIYLRTGQDSIYVELSTMVQVGVAIGFGVLALWLLGTSYGIVNSLLSVDESASLAAKLEAAEAKLVEVSEQAGQIPELEAALAEAKSVAAKAAQTDETVSLSAELKQTQVQLEDVRQQLSAAKAEEATLQAKLDAQRAAGDAPGDQPAEEASSLHAQLEDAFAENEQLQKARDEAEAKVAALTADIVAKDKGAERSEAMLIAATEEIERLQADLTEASGNRSDLEGEHKETIDRLTAMLNEEQSANNELQQRADTLAAELERQRDDENQRKELETDAEAEQHATAIASGLKEAELLATIEDLRAQISAQPEQSDETVDELKAELALAKSEIETLLKNTLTRAGKDEKEPVAVTPASAARPADPKEIKELKTELSNAQGDIIKLKSDIRAAKKRLAEQASDPTRSASKPDNSEKLEQQLASTRSRIQQLNKALADAKLREVAIDLALINVVPSPSPPAPR